MQVDLNHGTLQAQAMRQHARVPSAGQEQCIVICGGGASAVLLIHALRKHADRPLHVTIVEERPRSGTGLAYSTESHSHLLNVPAGRMSADVSDPDSFLTWLGANHPARNYTAKSFVPRWVYGSYLTSLLATASMDRRSPVQVRFRKGTVVSLERETSYWKLGLRDGGTIVADAVVVATGNAPPRPLSVADVADKDIVLNDPWDAAAQSEISRDADVALIGSGLTAVDIAVELLDKGHRGKIRMISRHGLLPRKHAPAMLSASWLQPPYPSSIAELMRRTRNEARSIPGQEAWRTAIDALRPHLPAIWGALNDADKARFLRHVRPFWEVHRHRMAPEIAARIEDAMAKGLIVIDRGRLLSVESNAPAGLRLRMKTQGKVRQIDAGAAINCTGPECNPLASRNPLIVSLLSKGLARPDPLHLGLDTDASGRLVGPGENVHQGLYAIGPVARGRLWEVTAVPEIRQQAAQLAQFLAPRASDRDDAYII